MIVTTDEHLCGFQHNLKADKQLETVGNGLSTLDSSHIAQQLLSNQKGFQGPLERRLLRGKKSYKHLSCHKEGLPLKSALLKEFTRCKHRSACDYRVKPKAMTRLNAVLAVLIF